MTRNQQTTKRGRGRRALLLGLASFGIALIAMTGAPAIAATASPGKPSPSATAASAIAPAGTAVPRKPSGIHADATSCADEFVILWSFTSSATTVPTGSYVRLTATMTCDIGPTPYFVQIFDTTTRQPVATCGAGTSCSVTLTQSAASTHNYVAYLDYYSSTYPPLIAPEQSLNTYVTWEAPQNGFTISLSGPASVQGSGTYTAYVNQDVGPTQYWIEIFNETTGRRLGSCIKGTQCSVTFDPAGNPGDDLVAFVCDLDTGLPPAATQASSNVLVTVQQPNF